MAFRANEIAENDIKMSQIRTETMAYSLKHKMTIFEACITYFPHPYPKGGLIFSQAQLPAAVWSKTGSGRWQESSLHFINDR